jgi:hypothetical protein
LKKIEIVFFGGGSTTAFYDRASPNRTWTKIELKQKKKIRPLSVLPAAISFIDTKEKETCTLSVTPFEGRLARFFLVENTKLEKIHKMTSKYTKWPQNIPPFFIPWLSKVYPNWVFG